MGGERQVIVRKFKKKPRVLPRVQRFVGEHLEHRYPCGISIGIFGKRKSLNFPKEGNVKGMSIVIGNGNFHMQNKFAIGSNHAFVSTKNAEGAVIKNIGASTVLKINFPRPRNMPAMDGILHTPEISISLLKEMGVEYDTMSLQRVATECKWVRTALVSSQVHRIPLNVVRYSLYDTENVTTGKSRFGRFEITKSEAPRIIYADGKNKGVSIWLEGGEIPILNGLMMLIPPKAEGAIDVHHNLDEALEPGQYVTPGNMFVMQFLPL